MLNLKSKASKLITLLSFRLLGKTKSPWDIPKVGTDSAAFKPNLKNKNHGKSKGNGRQHIHQGGIFKGQWH